LQYSDYALWQRSYVEGIVLEGELLYWEDQLSGVSSLSLPMDYARPSIQSTSGSNVGLRLDKELSSALVSLSKQEGVTLFMLLLSGFKVLLSRYSGQGDICVGTSIANRTQSDIEGMIGFFVNTLALRSDLSGNPSFRVILDRVKETTLGGYDHQLSPFEKVVDRVVKARDMSITPLFQVMFDLQNTPEEGSVALDGLVLSPYVYEGSTSQFDLSLTVDYSDGILHLDMEYCTALFDRSRIERMLVHYQTLLASIVCDPSTVIGSLDILPISEEDILLGRVASSDGSYFNPGSIDLGNSLPINVHFEDIVSRYGDAVALIHKEVSWNYEELNSYSNQIAHLLLDLGVLEEQCVGVYLERSVEFVGCMLGIIKSGGVYTPLDTQNPSSRIEKMLSKGTFSVLITTSCLLEELGMITNTLVVIIDEESDALLDRYEGLGLSIYNKFSISSQKTSNPPNTNLMDSWAYVLYTSGSTGEPKGAITRHNGAMNHLLAEYKLLDLPDGFRFLQSAGIGSDISVWQLLGPLLKGGVSVIVDKYELLEYGVLLDRIESSEVSIVEFVPTYMWGLLSYIQESNDRISLDSLQWIMLVGESIPVDLVNSLRELYPSIRLLNAYGPCEASDDVIQYEIVESLPSDQLRVPIGRVIPNMNVAILDSFGNLCPIGVSGELCVSGVGVGAGYLGLPERTALSFVDNPFTDLLGSVLYKTGDLARWLPYGDIEFLGREDHQVKIRGHRVELEDIASVLRSDVNVEDCHVLVHQSDQGDDLILCFIILSSEGLLYSSEVPITEFFHSLSKSELPSYMHPSQYCIVEEFPLNLSDKVDGKALLSLYVSEYWASSDSRASIYVSASSVIEKQLVAIWEELLGIDRVGLYDDFFELGGHSLLATRVVSMIRRDMKIEISIRDLFIHTRLYDLGVYLSSQSKGVVLPVIVSEERPSKIPLSFSQERLWFLDQLQGSVDYHMPAALRLEGNLDFSILEASLRGIVDRHEVLRTVIYSEEGIGYQKTLSSDNWSLGRESLDLEVDIETRITSFLENPFDLSRDYMFRACLYDLGEDDYILAFVFHHISSDGWSEGILISEFVELYRALSLGEEA
ncbi:non-ribosomal peptide synthetase, partial [Aquimarina longa]|uniref:non-ribosomal peptide synthetase n=1 Tax=Aquimarina longa TaxID=1080221 RepID=UPI0011DF9A2A